MIHRKFHCKAAKVLFLRVAGCGAGFGCGEEVENKKTLCVVVPVMQPGTGTV